MAKVSNTSQIHKPVPLDQKKKYPWKGFKKVAFKYQSALLAKKIIFRSHVTLDEKGIR